MAGRAATREYTVFPQSCSTAFSRRKKKVNRPMSYAEMKRLWSRYILYRTSFRLICTSSRFIWCTSSRYAVLGDIQHLQDPLLHPLLRDEGLRQTAVEALDLLGHLVCGMPEHLHLVLEGLGLVGQGGQLLVLQAGLHQLLYQLLAADAVVVFSRLQSERLLLQLLQLRLQGQHLVLQLLFGRLQFLPLCADFVQATEWAPDEETRRSCQSKGKAEVECQNYIRVLLVNKTEVMTCGTNAFQPLCITREL
ncbi:hypothetical protein CRUP_008610 [Coryphaenoides rupestris]|nr:hypothetical protein CRUP_008610 [Coryphaenoides rupestris]